MKRLTEKDWKDKCEGYPWNVHPVKDIDDLPYYKKLAAYEDDEEQGLLLRLPCKVGDKIFLDFAGFGKDIDKFIVKDFHLDCFEDGETILFAIMNQMIGLYLAKLM